MYLKIKQQLVTSKMTASEFVDLSLNDRAQLLWDRGKYLESVVYYGQTVKLYSLDAFFVEVYHSPMTQSIERVDVAHEQEMKKFLNQIKI